MSSTRRQLRLAAVGDNCVDRFSPSGRWLIGGNAVNVAVQWSRLGHRASYFGAVGTDEDGERTKTVMAAQGVDLAGLVTRKTNTAFTLIDVTADGERHMRAENFGACAGYEPDAADIERLLAMDHVHIGWLDDGGRLRRRLAEAGVSLSQDISVNARPENLGVAGLRIAFVSGDGDHDAARAQALRLRAEGARDVVVTRGAAGSSVFLGNVDIEVPAEKIVPVDTTGAGDSYIAGFLAALIGGRMPQEAAEAGAALAARTCLHDGGFPQAGN